MPKGKRLLSWREILLFNKDKIGSCLFGNAKKLFKFVDMAEMVFHKRKKN